MSDTVGCDVGKLVGGLCMPFCVGCDVVGYLLGCVLGRPDGIEEVGTAVGRFDGCLVGCPDGRPVG